MVLVKGPTLKPLYAHCLGGGPKPRITVTTHPAANGEWVWYLGGDIAEADGVAREPAEQIAVAKKELGNLLPWVDLSQAQWATLRVNRAEPAQSGLVRPDNAFLADQGRLLVGWPTKLALAPDFGLRQLTDELCAEAGISPQVVFEAMEIPTMEGLVAAGFGVAVVPVPRPERAEPGAAYVPLTESSAKRQIGLTWNADRPLPPAAARLAEFIMQNVHGFE